MMKRLSVFLLALAATCSSISACDRPQEISPDSESHFLQRCNDQCDGGLTCLCGVCTKACSATTECAALSPAATCGPGMTVAGNACQASPAAQVCDVGCNGDDACAGLGAGYTCQLGLCRSTPAAPSGSSPQSLRIALTGAAPDSKVIVFWNMQVGDHDGAYKSAEAPIVDGEVSLELLPLPMEVIQADTVVGGLFVVPSTLVIPDGMLDSALVAGYPLMKGFLLYRTRDVAPQPDEPSWPVAFPNGYSCGACQPAPTGFDNLEPSACGAPRPVVATADFDCNFS